MSTYNSQYAYRGKPTWPIDFLEHNRNSSKAAANYGGGGQGGLQLFIWKIIQYLVNNNTRINSVFCVLTAINLLLA